MSRTSRVLANVSLGYVQIALSSAFGLWFTPFLLRRVGATDFGLWAAGMPVLAYVGLVDFGVLTIFQRDVAFALGDSQGGVAGSTALPVLVGKTLRLVLLQVPALLVSIAIAWLLLPDTWALLREPLGLCFACLALTFPLRIYHALLIGLQDLGFLGVLSLSTWMLGAAGGALLVALGWHLNALAASWVLSQVVTYGVCVLRVRRRFPSTLGGGLPSLRWADASEKLRKGFWVLISQFAVMLNGADLLVIAAVLGPAAVTPYTITDKLVTMVYVLPTMIMAAAQPALSELSTSKERHRLADVCISLTRGVLLTSGLVATVVVVVDQGFVSWWVGSPEFGGRILVLLLVVDMVISHFTTAIAYGLFSFGYERLISVTGILGTAAATGASILLTRHLGVMGSPIATIAMRLLIAIPVFQVATIRAVGCSLMDMLGPVFALLWRLALLLAAGELVARTWQPRSVLGLAVAGGGATLAYALVMWPLVLGGPLAKYTRPRLAALRQRFS
jgi:O-antigen/teichoic acid export membrane protein